MKAKVAERGQVTIPKVLRKRLGIIPQRGGGRDRIAADFLIGGHATKQTERLLTRDLGFYRKYFKGLTMGFP